MWAKQREADLAKITSPLMKANAYQKGVSDMNYNYKIVGQIIGGIRGRQGISQEELARISGIARSHLAMIESGSKNANVETLWRISSALQMRLSDLIKLVEDEHARAIGRK